MKPDLLRVIAGVYEERPGETRGGYYRRSVPLSENDPANVVFHRLVREADQWWGAPSGFEVTPDEQARYWPNGVGILLRRGPEREVEVVFPVEVPRV